MTHTRPLPPIPSCLEPLTKEKRWVFWRWQKRKGKLTKPPFNPLGKDYAENNNPSTWATFDQARQVTGADGIGFQLMGHRELRAIDLDDCRDPKTGALSQWARDMVDRAQSYTEITPSETGLRIIGLGPETAEPVHTTMETEDGGHVELYRHAIRYICMTFNRLPGTPDTLGEIDHVIDDALQRYGKLDKPRPQLVRIERTGSTTRVDDLPDWLLRDIKACPAVGQRSEHAFGVICSLVEGGWTDEDIRGSAASDAWGTRYRDGDGNLEHDLRKARETTVPEPGAAKFKKSKPKKEKKKLPTEINFDGRVYELSQDGMAQAFEDRFKDSLRFCHSAGAWYEWSGQVWQKEKTPRASYLCRSHIRETTMLLEEEFRAGYRTRSYVDAVETLAKRSASLAVSSECWNQNGFLLGTPGGTVDLKTGELHPAKQTDYITRLTAVAPSEKGDRCPLWRQFLEETTAGDQDLQRFLQQVCGYALTGDTREHALFFVYGPGGNGKSVFLNTINGILAAYATTAAMDSFTASKNDRHPTDLAMLQGARLVSVSETEEGRAWAESRIKQLTGGDKISARFMRQDFFEFTPEFKLVIVGNHKPVLRNVDDAARRRFNIIPFIHKPEKPDRQLQEKLKAEWPAILRWMIEGCLEWQNNGLLRPDVVSAATDEYFRDQDTFSHFLAECCVVEPGNTHRKTATSKLFARWQEFAKANGEEPGSSKSFSTLMIKQGIEPARVYSPTHKGQVRGYTGISLVEEGNGDEF